MERQLALIEEPRDWQLDEHTREIGRAGVAKAREAMRDALARSARERAAAGHAGRDAA